MPELEIPTRYRLRVKQRLAVVTYAEVHGVKPAGRHFGLDRKTVRDWRDRYRALGLAGLLPRYPTRRRRRVSPRVVELAAQARQEHRFGAARTRIWLQRVHGISVAAQTITRIFRDLGLSRLPSQRRRRPRQLRLFSKDQPGDSVQVDVKFVKVKRQRYFQYTALDDCTRFRVLRLYRQLNHRTSLAFLREVRAAMPFPIRRLQSDNGTEWSLAFALSVEAAGIRHRYIRPRRPEQNGKVERSHRIDDEEFWQRQTLTSFDEATSALEDWERRYNFERFSMALQGQTPAEALALKLNPHPHVHDVSIGA